MSPIERDAGARLERRPHTVTIRRTQERIPEYAGLLVTGPEGAPQACGRRLWMSSDVRTTAR